MQQADQQSSATQRGWSVLHLFIALDEHGDLGAIELAIKSCQADEHQVVTAWLLGHKADLCVMAIGPHAERLRVLQSELVHAGAQISGSYVSLTELSEYSDHLPEAMREARLYPKLPPANMPAFCFYPMSKRRAGNDNWYSLDHESRAALMRAHGEVGRTFSGRVLQLVTGSTGLDDYEWGVTLFGRNLEDLKDCVYTMRFDQASYRYAEFGPFCTGMIGTPREVLDVLAGRAR